MAQEKVKSKSSGWFWAAVGGGTVYLLMRAFREPEVTPILRTIEDEPQVPRDRDDDELVARWVERRLKRP